LLSGVVRPITTTFPNSPARVSRRERPDITPPRGGWVWANCRCRVLDRPVRILKAFSFYAGHGAASPSQDPRAQPPACGAKQVASEDRRYSGQRGLNLDRPSGHQVTNPASRRLYGQSQFLTPRRPTNSPQTSGGRGRALFQCLFGNLIRFLKAVAIYTTGASLEAKGGGRRPLSL